MTADRPDLLVRLEPTGDHGRWDAARLLRESAAWMASVPACSVEIGRRATGAPFLSGAADGLHASVSHTNAMVAVAVSRLGPVGVDVEPVRPLPARQLGRRWFAPAEVAWLDSRPEDEVVAGFLALWTAKEAIGKYLGQGLRGGGMSREVPLPAPGWLSTVDGSGAVVAHHSLPGYALAVASVATVTTARVELHRGGFKGIRSQID